MTSPSINLFRRLTSALLAVCLSICCCQTSVLFDGLALEESIATAGHSCCTDSCPTDSQDDDGDSPSEPGGCTACCVKGSGLKDASVLPATVVATVPVVEPPAIVTLPAGRDHGPDRRVEFARLRVEPPTLLRLRCALIV